MVERHNEQTLLHKSGQVDGNDSDGMSTQRAEPTPHESSPDHATQVFREPEDVEKNSSRKRFGLEPPSGFEIVEMIGKGGMGIVYRAIESAFDRDVALKVLSDKAANSETVRRFIEEARITGQLEHPGIPAAYQVGFLKDEMPYLAMKLIRGKTLNDLLFEHGPSSNRWLTIFEGICQAVGYAHSKGVVHRDLKPHNVMVGAFGEVQVMDWGLAKVLPAVTNSGGPSELVHADTTDISPESNVAMISQPIASENSSSNVSADTERHEMNAAQTDVASVMKHNVVKHLIDQTSNASSTRPNVRDKVTESTRASVERLKPTAIREATMMGSIVGTPAYMPPEQARGEIDRISAATDVFGLGAILAALLTGKPPYTGTNSNDTFRRAMQGDLQECFERLNQCDAETSILALCRRCLSANPNDRPANGAEVANSLEQIRLASEQRVRHAESERQRAEIQSREAKRRRTNLLIAGGLLCSVLTAGIIGTTYGLVEANKRRGEAEQAQLSEKERANAEQVARSDAELAQTKAEQSEKIAQQALQQALNETEWARTTLSFLVDDVIRQADSYQQVDRELINPNLTVREAIEAATGRIEKRTEDRPHIAPALRHPIGDAYVALGNFADGIKQLELAFSEATKFRGSDDAHTLAIQKSLAQGYLCNSNYPQAIQTFNELLEKIRRVQPIDRRTEIHVEYLLSIASREMGDQTAALDFAEKAAVESAKEFGEDDGLSLHARSQLAVVLLYQGQQQRALEMFNDVLERRQRLNGDEHLATLEAMAWTGWCYNVRHEPGKAIPLFERALAGRSAKLGAEHPYTLTSTDNLGLAYSRTGRTEEGIALLEIALEGRRKIAPNNLQTFWSIINLASALNDAGRLVEAATLFQEGYDRQTELFGKDYPNAIVCLSNWAESECRLGHFEKALPKFERAYEYFSNSVSPTAGNALIAQLNIADCKLFMGHWEEARKSLEEVIPIAQQATGESSPLTIQSLVLLTKCAATMGDRQKTVALVDESVAKIDISLGATSYDGALHKIDLAESLMKVEESEKAEQLAVQAAVAMAEVKPNGWELPSARSVLGWSLNVNKKQAEAEPVLLDAYQGLNNPDNHVFPRDYWKRHRTALQLSELFTQQDKLEEAKLWSQVAQQHPPSSSELSPPEESQ